MLAYTGSQHRLECIKKYSFDLRCFVENQKGAETPVPQFQFQNKNRTEKHKNNVENCTLKLYSQK